MLSPKASQKSSKDKGMMMSKAPKYTRRQIHLAKAITTVEHALQNVGKYSEALRQSPLNAMSSLMNALNLSLIHILMLRITVS